MENNNNRLQSVEFWMTRIVKWLSYISAGCAAITMVIAVADVVGVKLFRSAIPSSVEYIEELMVFIVFLSIAYVELERGHIRVTILEGYMPKLVKYIFRLTGHALGILVIGFLSWRGLELVKYSLITKLVKDGTVKFPLWPSHLAVFIGFACLTIVYILLFSKAVITRPKN